MGKFTDAERARIWNESLRILEDKPAAPPQPSRASVMRTPPLVIEDPVDKWRREADQAEREREREKAQLQRAAHERQAAYERAAQNSADTEARLTDLEQRMDNVEAHIAALSEAVSAAADFSNNAVTRFDDVKVAFERLNSTVQAASENTKSELSALRDRVAGKETSAARERAADAEQLNEARFARTQRDTAREHSATRQRIAALNDDVASVTQLVIKDIQRRQH
jgi:DNA repair exonuclease SbcCD ATPase subunit